MKYVKYSVTIILVIIGTGLFLLNQPKKGISEKSPDFTINPQSLLQEFETNEQAANKKYLDKIIILEGKINSISSHEDGVTTILIDTDNPMSNISCQLSKEESVKSINLKNGDLVKIKGICTGILMDVILVECVVVNEN